MIASKRIDTRAPGRGQVQRKHVAAVLRQGTGLRKRRLLVGALLVACWSLAGSTTEADGKSGKDVSPKGTTPPPKDQILLSSGVVVQGILRDILPAKVLLEESGKLRSFAQSDVKEIKRGLPAAFFEFFTSKSLTTTTLKDWRRLASFCKKKHAYPEYRACLREILKLRPADGEATGVLGASAPKKNRIKKSFDEKFVREKLEEYLSPSSLRFLRDGRVHIVFNLSNKNADQQTSFTPHIASDLASSFRWTRSRDEKGEQQLGIKSTEPVTRGVKVADNGTAFLNCWFLDDIEASCDYAPVGTASRKQRVAPVFGARRKHLAGSNLGTQCVTFNRGRLTGVHGKAGSLAFKETLRFKLVVKDGTFEARFQKRTQQEKRYKLDRFKRGQVGFLWSGGAAGIILQFEVIGKLDYPRTAEEIRGLRKRGRRKRG